MKILLISDLHFTNKPIDEYRWGLFEHLLCLGNFNAVYILGDLTDAKDNHPAPLVNRLVENLAKLANEYPVTILRGNHDGIDHNIPYFEFLSKIPGITYLKEITTIGDELFLPHSRNPKEDWKDVDMAGKKVFAHVTVYNSLFETGVREKDSNSPNAEIFDKAKIAFSGDIHSPQKVGSLIYVGCPYRVRFNDTFQGGAVLLDDVTGEWERLPFKFLNRHTFDITSIEDLREKLEKTHPMGGDQVKVRLHLTPETMGTWRNVKTNLDSVLASWGIGGLELHGFELVREKTEVIKTNVPLTSVVNFDEICKDLKVTKELAAVGKEIIQAVR